MSRLEEPQGPTKLYSIFFTPYGNIRKHTEQTNRRWRMAHFHVLQVFLLGSVAAATAADPCAGVPPDWAEGCATGDLLYARDDCCVTPAAVRPEIGNGFLAMQVGSPPTDEGKPPSMPTTITGPLFVAGVFNGCGAKSCAVNPSHRAAVSVTYKIYQGDKRTRSFLPLINTIVR